MTFGGDGGPGGGTVTTTANGAMVRSVSTNGPGGSMTPQEMAKMQEDMAARVKEAEANRKTVEFRIFYADYKPVDGIKLPTRIQKMTDGLPTEELSLERIKVNGKIDPVKFAVVK